MNGLIVFNTYLKWLPDDVNESIEAGAPNQVRSISKIKNVLPKLMLLNLMPSSPSLPRRSNFLNLELNHNLIRNIRVKIQVCDLSNTRASKYTIK